jgi:hypothetical protein
MRLPLSSLPRSFGHVAAFQTGGGAKIQIHIDCSCRGLAARSSSALLLCSVAPALSRLGNSKLGKLSVLQLQPARCLTLARPFVG